jgi:ribosomal-protein-alanine N-acetyltransferase
MQSRKQPEPSLDRGLLMMIGFRKKLSTLIRPLTTDDAHACSKIHAQSFKRGWTASEFQQLILDSNVFSDGCFDSGKPLLAVKVPMYGFAISRLIAGEAEILTIAVDPSARGSRIATAILTDHIGALRLAGCQKLFLEVAEDNAAALSLYRAFNFRKVGERPEYYGGPGEKQVNAHILLLDM